MSETEIYSTDTQEVKIEIRELDEDGINHTYEITEVNMNTLVSSHSLLLWQLVLKNLNTGFISSLKLQIFIIFFLNLNQSSD